MSPCGFQSTVGSSGTRTFEAPFQAGRGHSLGRGSRQHWKIPEDPVWAFERHGGRFCDQLEGPRKHPDSGSILTAAPGWEKLGVQLRRMATRPVWEGQLEGCETQRRGGRGRGDDWCCLLHCQRLLGQQQRRSRALPLPPPPPPVVTDMGSPLPKRPRSGHTLTPSLSLAVPTQALSTSCLVGFQPSRFQALESITGVWARIAQRDELMSGFSAALHPEG